MAALLGSGSIVVSYFASLVAAKVSADILRTLVAVFMIGPRRSRLALSAQLTYRQHAENIADLFITCLLTADGR